MSHAESMNCGDELNIRGHSSSHAAINTPITFVRDRAGVKKAEDKPTCEGVPVPRKTRMRKADPAPTRWFQET